MAIKKVLQSLQSCVHLMKLSTLYCVGRTMEFRIIWHKKVSHCMAIGPAKLQAALTWAAIYTCTIHGAMCVFYIWCVHMTTLHRSNI